ncbi:37S ribosomal protein S23, mitochondrial [Psilocybe cubensis]|uniref:Small ribosomal subunit protein mS29 n=2 Tax=Psilocybe cubensis TaxID=181762 RepID=A0A8H7XJT8_PSICU|nr:37S ribosomal protein S23, mitochondrial [Psilocybe cubensis]KAH9479917.1 37S ribosomal protein S23, mitochondrial [Psilocybe cubensis]
MSLLAPAARAGPSRSTATTAAAAVVLGRSGAVVPRRHSSTRPVPGTPSQPGYFQKKDPNEKLRRKIPTFKQLQRLPASQMVHELFNGNTVGSLESLPLKSNVARTPSSLYQIRKFEMNRPDPLNVYGAPRNLKYEYTVLTKPYNVVREITQEALRFVSHSKGTPSLDSRVVLTGRAGSGKSVLLLQIVECTIQDGWVVIYIPRAVNLVNSTTPYVYNIRTQTYQQPSYSFQILQRMLTVNGGALSKIQLSEDLVLERQTVRAGTPLSAVIEIAIAEKERSIGQSPAILEAVMKSLEVQTQYPVLLAVDDFQALYGKTAYRDPHFDAIRSYHLSIPRMIMEYASGRRNFARGAVFGALSLSQSNYPLPLELRDALQLQELDAYPVSPYLKRSKDMLAYTEGLRKLEVPAKLSMQEALAVFEIWKKRMAIGKDNSFYDEIFLSKYTESGGNARDFIWKGLLSTTDL